MKLPYTLLIACALFFPISTLYGLDGWMTDLNKARREAAEQHKDLFIVYQGDSWHPEQYSTPESMFTCDSVKKHLEKSFIPALQEYPAEFSGNSTFFTFNINVHNGALDFAFFPEQINRFTRCVFATSDNVPYYVTEQKSSWLDLKAKSSTAEKKKIKVLTLLRNIQTTSGEQKYRLIGRLFRLTGWETGLPASLYPRLYEETIRNDHNNLSGISDINYVRQMQGNVWNTFWLLKGFEFVAPGAAEIPQNVRSSLDQEAIQILEFIKVSLDQGSLLMGENAYTGELEDFLAICQKKTGQILAEAPLSETACKIKLQSHAFFPRIYYFTKLTSTSPNPQRNLDILSGIMDKLWVDKETEQLFRSIEAACCLKMGNLDKDLELMKKSREIAPWTENATAADASVQPISRQLPALRQLWEKKQSGDQEAAKAYQKEIGISPSMYFSVCP